MEVSQIYRCNVCGNLVELVGVGGGTMICCGQAMTLLEGGETDAAQEKHVPVIEKVDGGIKIKVGSVEHPMEDGHYIQWIEILFDGRVGRQMLAPGDKPEAIFKIAPEKVTARAYCNLHGLWKTN